MLRKLIKYEFKATSRFMLLMFAVLIALSAIISISLKLNLDEAMQTISESFNLGGLIFGVLAFLVMTFFVIMTVAVLCAMFFYAITRFKNNLLGNEGYLMHTLPVKMRDHLISKCLVSVIWTILSVIAVGIAYFILLLGISETNIFREMIELLANAPLMYPQLGEAILLLAEFALLCVVALVNTYFHIYASMAIGYSSNTHRAAKSIGTYIGFTVIVNIIETVLVSPFLTLGIGVGHVAISPHAVMWCGIALTLPFTIGFYFITHYSMKKKLNLQ